MHDWRWDYGWMPHGFGAGWIVMLLLLTLLVVSLVILVRWFAGSPAPPSGTAPPSGDRALALLRERYARGEIDREEFEERKRVLEEQQ